MVKMGRNPGNGHIFLQYLGCTKTQSVSINSITTENEDIIVAKKEQEY